MAPVEPSFSYSPRRFYYKQRIKVTLEGACGGTYGSKGPMIRQLFNLFLKLFLYYYTGVKFPSYLTPIAFEFAKTFCRL